MSGLCFSRPMLQRILDHTDLMDRMLQRVGVDPAAAVRADQGMAWYEARSRCIGCLRERDCRNWLRGAENAVEAPEFCLNARFLRRCKIGVDPVSRNTSRVCDAGQGAGHTAPHVRCPEECS